MSTPVSAPRTPFVHPLPTVTASAAVGDSVKVTAPFDFLLVSSRTDFDRFRQQFIETCEAAGMRAEILYVEDLAGTSPGDKLASLQRLSTGWLASGAVGPGTIKVTLLHGWVGVPPADASIDFFRQACTGSEQAGTGGTMHMLTAANGRLAFPTDLFDAALRASVVRDGQMHAGFVDTVIYGACGSGMFREAAKSTGGSYVFGSGKKNVFTDDFHACLCAVIREQARRKRACAAPLSVRDCWQVMREVSGEHVSLVDSGTVAINKLPQSAHSAPTLAVRAADAVPAAGSEDSAQGIRALFAKVHHGAVASVQRVIDRWGSGILTADHGALLPGVSLWSAALASPREGEQKIRLLLSLAPGCLAQRGAPQTLLNGALERQSTPLLCFLFERMLAVTPPPLSQEDFVIWLRSRPDLAERLVKYCRSSREVSTSVGAYLVALLPEASGEQAPGIFHLPPFFDNLARKTAARLRQTAAQ